MQERNVLGYGDLVTDGFYDVWGPTHIFPQITELESETDINAQVEAVIVDSAKDAELQSLLKAARELRMSGSVVESSGNSQLGIRSLAVRLAEIVGCRMGGSIKSDADLTRGWLDLRRRLRVGFKTNVLLVGLLTVGLSRHRCLLFKVCASK